MSKFMGVQQLILESKTNNQLVSAGAGSGKTTVMIEKIANLILKENIDIDNLLIVTFTVLAAQEMKERLIKKLTAELENNENKERVVNIIEKINTASIDTIDGFSAKTIKKYFYDLQINPDIQIITDSTKDYYITKAMKKTFNDYLHHNDKISLLLDLYGGNRRNLDAIEELILNIFKNIINLEDYEAFLNNSFQEYQNSLKSEKVVNDYLCEIANEINQKIIENYSQFSNTVKTKLQNLVQDLEIFNKNINFKTNLKSLMDLQNIKFSTKDYHENISLKELSKEINQIFNLRKILQNNEIDEDFDAKNERIVDYFSIFLDLLKNFINNYNNIKQKNNLIDFNDLNRLMLKLLSNENIKKELQSQYTHVFVDEYQDVNPLQDKLISNLISSNSKLFMVGDVKQSIYGFRGASPEWFLNKYNNLKEDVTSGNVFDMNINFRTNPKVLNFINLVFKKLMTKEIADIDYKKDCLIEPKRTDIIDDKVHVLLIKDNKSKNITQGVYSVKNDVAKKEPNVKDKEAALVLQIITSLIGTDFYDANLKQTRKLTYADIAILTRSDKDENAKVLVDVLKQNNVPINVNNKLDVNSSEIIRLILSILKCVTGMADDVDYLAAFMGLTNFSINDAIELRNTDESFYKNLIFNKQEPIIAQGFEIIKDIKNASYTRSNSELIYYILDNKKLRYFILQKENGEKEIQLVEEFISKLSNVENSLSLAEFIEVVQSNVNKAGDFASVDNEDSVTIQTIHKSKGLEYPVVILYNSSKMFSYLRDNEAINFNVDIGLGVDYFDVENRTKSDSLTKLAIKLLNNKKGYKEELRLLYVALTRVKNKLFITGNYTDMIFEEINKTSYSNMILSCFIDNIENNYLNKEDFEIQLIEDIEIIDGGKMLNNRAFESLGYNFIYTNQNKFNISLKNSVTGINSQQYQKDGYVLKQVLNNAIQYEIEDKAIIGTHYHKALEKLNFSEDYIQNSNFDDVDYKKIKLAHEKIKALTYGAIRILKEAEFMMYVPYNQVVESEIKDKVLIQGVVDLLIEKEDSLTLVDYKFSSLPSKVLKKKYEEQLKLYKLAIEQAFNKTVEHIYIYSINSDELI